MAHWKLVGSAGSATYVVVLDPGDDVALGTDGPQPHLHAVLGLPD